MIQTDGPLRFSEAKWKCLLFQKYYGQNHSGIPQNGNNNNCQAFRLDKIRSHVVGIYAFVEKLFIKQDEEILSLRLTPISSIKELLNRKKPLF